MKYNFDEIVSRKNTNALKLEALSSRWKRTDLLPMWVADMDFKSPPCITKAIEKRLKNGIFGYTSAPEEWKKSIILWHQKRNHWKISPEMISFLPGIVPGLSLAVQCFTTPGDSVMLMAPIYTPFRLAIENHNRVVTNCPLKLKNNKYSIDFNLFEEKIKDCKLLLFCNPHNPGGIVWKKQDLIKIAEVCQRHNVLVVSDEIHSDLTFSPAKHNVFSTCCNAARDNSIIFNAPSKAFNLAGFCTAYAVIENPILREKFNLFAEKSMSIHTNVFAYLVTIAAYQEGEPWLNEVLQYIKKNIEYFIEFLNKNMPKIKAIPPEASYLVFLDCRDLGFSENELSNFFVNEANLALNEGSSYGEESRLFMRINLACPRAVVERATEQILSAYKKHF